MLNYFGRKGINVQEYKVNKYYKSQTCCKNQALILCSNVTKSKRVTALCFECIVSDVARVNLEKLMSKSHTGLPFTNLLTHGNLRQKEDPSNGGC